MMNMAVQAGYYLNIIAIMYLISSQSCIRYPIKIPLIGSGKESSFSIELTMNYWIKPDSSYTLSNLYNWKSSQIAN